MKTTKIDTKKGKEKDLSPDKGSLPRWINSSLMALPNERLMEEKQKTKWHRLSSEEFAKKIKILALELKKLGIKKGESVGIIGPTGISWVIYDQAIMSCGAVTVGIFENVSDFNFKYQVKQANIKTLMVSGKNGYQKCAANSEIIDRIIVDESYTPPQSQKKFKKNQIISFNKIIERKKNISEKETKEWEKMFSQLEADQVASIVYTSGTTGLPKGVVLTHRCFMNQIKHITKCFRIFGERDHCVSFLPLAHIFERIIIYFYLSRGVSISFCKEIEKLGETLKEVKPTIMTTVPRFLEKVFEKIQQKAQKETGLKKIFMQISIDQALKKKQENEDSIVNKIYNYFIYKKILKSMGGNFRFIISGGAALREKEYLFFTNIGLPIFQGYGLTETSPVISTNYPGSNKALSVGLPLEGISVKLSKTGELLVKSDSLMKGYLKKPKETAAVIDKKGWFSTGDIAKIDKKGFITIIRRSKELFKMSTGKYICSMSLERELCKNTFVEHALIIADNKKYASALIFVNPSTKEENEKKRKIIEKTIQEINSKKDPWEQIKKHVIIEKKLSVEEEELTPKMNVKRAAIEKNYAKIIEEIYTKS